MRPLGLLAVALLTLGLLLTPSPGGAQVASIQTMAPLEDHSDEAIQRAVGEAVKTAVRGALAMGLPWVRLNQARVFDHMVSIELLATDRDPAADGAEPRADGESKPEPEQPAKIAL